MKKRRFENSSSLRTSDTLSGTAGEIEKGRLETAEEESILTRKNIEAPPGYVSVFHETKESSLSGIDENGLVADPSERNIGKGRIEVGNAMFNEYVPDAFKFDVTRDVIFAYPILGDGHDQRGADMIFVVKKKKHLEGTYDTLSKTESGSDYLKNDLQVSDMEGYVKKMTDPSFLRSQHAGEVLEIKVDPEKCYVGDADYIDALARIGAGFSDADREYVQQYAERYWKDMITLKEFFQWYRRPEYDEGGNDIKDADDFRDEYADTNSYFVLQDSPGHLPNSITKPEVLIPQQVPQKHIRVLRDDDIPEAG